MSAPYKIVVGLEVHVQLLTRTKLFCGCSTKFGQPPNSQTCPVCLGMPGVLPVMNRNAFELALKAALALNCHINPFTKWDRKNYYYPDLPKNYQISQYDKPFSEHGYLEIATPDGVLKRVGIIRAHLEEDAGKSMHDESGRGGDSKVDLNRTGTPLVEIVSEPDINSPEQAGEYLRELRLMMRELGVSDCEMQEGSLRCDANVNVHIPREDGSFVATPLVEVKNLNSISAVEKAVAYEAKRQYEAFNDAASPFHGRKFGEVPKATRGWDEKKQRTWEQRQKEEAADYRYFPEPDLVPVVVDDAWLDRIREEMGELPAEQRSRLQGEPYSLSSYEAGVLTSKGRKFVAYFEAVAHECGDPKAACNWITNDVLAAMNERKVGIDEFPIQAPRLAGLIRFQAQTNLNKQRSRELFADLLENPEVSAEDAAKARGFDAGGIDEAQLREIIRRGIAANPKAVEDFKGGNAKAAGRISGFVMKETKGMANMKQVQPLIEEEIMQAS